MQKIILFIESSDVAYRQPISIGNLYLNRFTIDEDYASEIINIYQLQKVPRYLNKKEREQKGMDRIFNVYQGARL